MSAWIVMTSCARISGSETTYRNIALVQITDEYARTARIPRMISRRARGVLAVEHLGHHHVGRTERGDYQRALIAAEHEAAARNAQSTAVKSIVKPGQSKK